MAAKKKRTLIIYLSRETIDVCIKMHKFSYLSQNLSILSFSSVMRLNFNRFSIPNGRKCDLDRQFSRIRICLIFLQILSQEWTGDVGKIVNVADATSVMRPNTLYFGTLYLHFKYISRLCIYKF